MKTYTLREMLDYKGIRLPIKERYTEREFLLLKPNLSSPPERGIWGGGACMLYDPMPAKARAWANKKLRPKNMLLVQDKRTWAKVVRLDDKQPLPKDYFTFGEKVIGRIPERFFNGA